MTLDLQLPKEEEIKQQVIEELKPTPEENTAITSLVEQNGQDIMNVDLDSLQSRKEITTTINDFGKDLVTKSESKNDILQKRLVTIGSEGSSAHEVADTLTNLSVQMRDLDPSEINFTNTGILGKIFNPIKNYFEKYKKADTAINDIMKHLDNGKKTLTADNTTLEIEEVNMRNMTKELNQKIATGEQLDAYLTNAIENERANGGDEDKIKFVEEEVLYPLRQRIMDFQQLLVVNQQGIVAMEVIRKNNAELIRSVDRAKMVTTTSLRTAVTVAQSLYDQQLVLKSVDALNKTTNNMISATSKMLKEQGVAIQKQASEANISADTLKQSFADCISALDDISNYKQEALPQMRNTIEEFRQIAEEGEKQLQRIEKREKMSIEG